jgi:hypothetical protein
MSSRVRYIVKLNDGWYGGVNALNYLQAYSHIGPKVRTMAQAVAAANEIGAKIWVFREPRKVAFNRSRYKRLCQHFGIGKRKYKKPVMAVPHIVLPNPPIHYEWHGNYAVAEQGAVPQGAINAEIGNHPPAGGLGQAAVGLQPDIGNLDDIF